MRVNNNFISTVTAAGSKMKLFFSIRINWDSFEIETWSCEIRGHSTSLSLSTLHYLMYVRYIYLITKQQIDLNSKKTMKMIDEIRIETRQNNHCCNTTETPQEDFISKLESLKFLINHHFLQREKKFILITIDILWEQHMADVKRCCDDFKVGWLHSYLTVLP